MLAADIVVPVVLERQSDILQQHFKVLKLLVPIYSFTFCDITGCNTVCLSINPVDLLFYFLPHLSDLVSQVQGKIFKEENFFRFL